MGSSSAQACRRSAVSLASRPRRCLPRAVPGPLMICFPIGTPMCARRSSVARPHVQQVVVILDDAGIDLEVRDTAGERIGHRLEDERRLWFRVGDRAVHTLVAGGGVSPDRAATAEGKYSTMKFSSRSVPDIAGAPSRIGWEIACPSRSPRATPAIMCSSGRVPFSKNSSINSSLPSAMISTSASCAVFCRLRHVGRESDLPFPCRRRPACTCTPSWRAGRRRP